MPDGTGDPDRTCYLAMHTPDAPRTRQRGWSRVLCHGKSIVNVRTNPPAEIWPALPLNAWRETYVSLHMWSQIVGKVRLALAPKVNHWWHVPLYVGCNGLTTGPVPHRRCTFHVDFDFLHHELQVGNSDGSSRAFPLVAMPVATFYRQLMETLADLGLEVSIWPVPVEVPVALPFEENDAPGAYDRVYAERFWRALLQIDRVFHVFRGRYLGKTSPVHFFWGAFDLAVTRFSGRLAPPHPGGIPNVGAHVMREAYSHEVSSAGFWPGGGGVEEAMFYSYAYPEPEGFRTYPIHPEGAYYHPEMGEFLLPYDRVRTASHPDDLLLRFLQSTYDAAADRGAWDRAALERASSAAPTHGRTP
jgi:hypothetical protein